METFSQPNTQEFNCEIPQLTTVLWSMFCSTSSCLDSFLPGSVTFVAWDNFDSDVKEAMNNLHSVITPEDRRDAQVFLDAVKLEITPSETSIETLNNIPDVDFKGASNHMNGKERVSIREDRVFSDEISLIGPLANIFNAVNSLVQRSFGTSRFFFGTQLASLSDFNVEVQTTEDEDSMRRLQEVASDGQDDKSLNKHKILTDFALLRLEKEGPLRGTPICYFEVKGPEKNITGRPPIKPKKDEGSSAPVNSFVKVPLMDVEDSTENFLKRLNLIFSKRKQGRGRPPKSESSMASRSARKPVLQALAYAVLSESKCTCLLNYSDGIAFELVLDETSENILVRTALVRAKTGGSVSHVPALYYLSLYSTRKVVSAETAKAMRDVLFRNEGRSDDNVDDEKKKEDEKPPKDEGPSSPKRRKTGAVKEGHAVSSGINHSENTELRSSSDNGSSLENRGSSTSSLDKEGIDVESALKCAGTLMGKGYAANVFEGSWRGQKLAIKLWNKRHGEGVLQICKEISTFRFLQNNCPSVLGRAVPMLHLFWNKLDDYVHCGEKVGIVTDFVGSEIFYDEEGRLVVRGAGEDYVVSYEEKDALCTAATSSFNDLHRNRVLHGDVALRNMRVERKKNSLWSNSRALDETLDAGDSWHVWWIDLGRSRVFAQK